MTEHSGVIKQLYSVYDNVAAAFHPPFSANNEKEAIRIFSSIVSDPQSMLNKHPDDYVLFHLCSMNATTGEIEPVNPPYHVVSAAVVLVANPENK